jgi:hypothetical protein
MLGEMGPCRAGPIDNSGRKIDARLPLL